MYSQHKQEERKTHMVLEDLITRKTHNATGGTSKSGELHWSERS